MEIEVWDSAGGEAASAAALSAHLNDTSDAHDASAISILDTAGDFLATNVEDALAELQSDHESDSAALAAHLADTSDAHDAEAVSFQPFGSIAASNVQDAIEEVFAEAAGGGGSGVAIQRDIAQVAHGLAVGNVVRHNGTGFVKAQADAVANAEVVGIVVAVADVDNFTLHFGGYTDVLSGLVAGTVYFLSELTAGLLTATEPTDNGEVTKPLFIATSATAGYFFNFRGAEVGSGVVPAEDVTVDSTNLEGTGTDLQTVLEELEDQIDAVGGSGGGITGYETRSSNTILGVADLGKVIDITATITQTFEADETLGDAWWVILRNATDDGTTVVTLDFAGAETCDGLTTVVMYSGESRLIICNGAAGNFNSVLLSPGFARFTADGNFIVPHGITRVTVDCVGGGGGGGGGGGANAGQVRQGGSGGGGGARSVLTFGAAALGNPGDTIAVDVAAGGTAGTGGSGGNGTAGGAGGPTTFGSLLTAFGGGGGSLGLANSSTQRLGGSGGGQGEAGETGTTASTRGGGHHTAGLAGAGGQGGGSASGANDRGAEYGGAGGGLCFNTGGVGLNGGKSVFGGGGGASGGGVTTANAESQGGTGGTTGTTQVTSYSSGGGGAVDGGAGPAGADGDTRLCGAGGSGGGSQASGTGGAGGNGGAAGGGGGGGGGGTSTGGAGGTGGRGECRVYYE